MRAVIFDDELSERQAAYRIAGISLAFFPHADDAVAVTLRERPDVVLMDFTMHADRSGAEAIAALRALQKSAAPRLLLVAISNDEVANARMLEAGADDAVPKTHVRGYLEKLLEKKRLDDLDGQKER